MAECRQGGWQPDQDHIPMGDKSLPPLGESGWWDKHLPQDDPWKFLSLAMTLMMLLLVLIIGAVLGNVLQVNYQMQEELNQLSEKFTQGLADARHNRDTFWGELFRQIEAVQAGNESSCNPCPEAWMAFEGSCYNFTMNKLNWIEARDSCTQDGAHLVIINSEAEQKFLTSKGARSWIGLRKQYENEPYMWQDGSALTYANWDHEISYWYGCVYMEPSGYWRSTFCELHWPNSWICEKPQVC